MPLWVLILLKNRTNMKKIKVVLQREVEVEVLIDETVIDKSAIDTIYDHFDDEIYNEPASCEDKLSDYECGLYNYALSAAMTAANIAEVEYIALDKGHTTTKVVSDYLESEFEKMETV